MQPISLAQEVRCEQADGSVFIRSGSCNQCGDCCKDGDPFAGEQTNPLSPCRMLGHVDGKYVCTGRTSSVYLSGCASWPSAPEHLVSYPNCGYTFRRA